MTDLPQTHRPKTPVLDRVRIPADMKGMSDRELRQLADELRSETISTVSETGGHLGAGLGVVELTVAIHAVFDTPRDKLIWDVGHQCYPHKILTGRRDRIRTLRTEGGLSGFTKRSESPYDPFGAAHSSTSISAALGFKVAADLGGDPGDAIAVIGDGSMSAGMAFEAMNNAGHLGKRLFVILNDNEMSIAPPVGALSSYLSRLYAGAPFQELKAAAKGAVSLLPGPLREQLRALRSVVSHTGIASAAVAPGVLSRIAGAIRNRVRLRFGYSSDRTTGDLPTRRVEPYRLVAADRSWYLSAFDLDRDDWRLFRLDRMSQVNVSTLGYRPRDDEPDPIARLAARPSDRYVHTVRISIDAPLATLQDWFGEYRDRLVAIDEATTEIPTFTDDPAHVPSWLIGLPYDYRVLGDDAVREACARAARRMAVAAEADN